MTLASLGASQVSVIEPSAFTVADRFRGAGGGSTGAANTVAVAPAGQFFFVTGVIGEGDPHLDGLALVTVYQGVGAACSPADVRVVRQPLVGEGGVCQAVGVVDSRSVSC